jgi:hypothetical protein
MYGIFFLSFKILEIPYNKNDFKHKKTLLYNLNYTFHSTTNTWHPIFLLAYFF